MTLHSVGDRVYWRAANCELWSGEILKVEPERLSTSYLVLPDGYEDGLWMKGPFLTLPALTTKI